MKREDICKTVHGELGKLLLRQGKAGFDVPKNGLYFWYEEDELSHGGKPRITRVGTHEKQGRLPARINQHFSGVREGSVFRKHLGGALMKLNAEPEAEVKAWYKKRKEDSRFNDPEFKHYEEEVTNQAEDSSYRVLRVDDSSERLNIEEKFIALFSHCEACCPSKKWLGNYAYRKEIRDSGLWNVKHIHSVNEFTPNDLPRLRLLIDETPSEC